MTANPSYTLHSLAQTLALPAPVSNSPITSFQVDSRAVSAGSLFFALKGDRADGHDFLESVYNQGAVAAIVDQAYSGSHPHLPLFKVDNVLKTLQMLAREKVSCLKPRIIAVTGSVGKTGTKEWIYTLVKDKYNTLVSQGNQNSQVGLPLTLLNQIKGHEELLILEMGMTHPKEIETLVSIAPPEVAVLTTLALVHAEKFASLEAIGAAKAEIFSHPLTKLAIVEEGLLLHSVIKEAIHIPLKTFSFDNPVSDYSINTLGLVERKSSRHLSLKDFPFRGTHHAQNFAAAVAVARYLNVDFSSIERLIPLLTLPEKRSQWIERPYGLFFNDSYNACEISVKAALDSLPAAKKGGKKIALLGSMLELGLFSTECHRQVARYALDRIDCLYCVGKECLPMVDVWQEANRPVFWFETREKLVSALKNQLSPLDIILVKGSSSLEMWKIIDELSP